MREISTKSKGTLKNFSPIAFEVKPIEWSIEDNEEIHELRSLFSFKSDFDLHARLANLPLDIATFVEIERLQPTEKETASYLKKIKNKTSQSISSLQKKTLLPKSVQNKILELNHLFEIMGSHHLKLISANTPGATTTINELIKALDLLCDEDYLNKVKINLLGILQGIDNAQSKLPIPKPGRKKIKLEAGIIHTLIYIYTNGTGLEAKCYWYPNPEQDQYAGKFYEFLLKTIALLEKHIKIKPLSKQTWGDYAREVITYHYSKQ